MNGAGNGAGSTECILVMLSRLMTGRSSLELGLCLAGLDASLVLDLFVLFAPVIPFVPFDPCCRSFRLLSFSTRLVDGLVGSLS